MVVMLSAGMMVATATPLVEVTTEVEEALGKVENVAGRRSGYARSPRQACRR